MQFDAATDLAPDEQALLETARRFAAGPLAGAAPAVEASGATDPDLLRQAAELGLTGIELPVALGGSGASFACKSRICEALAEVDFSAALSIVNTHNAALRLARHGTKAAVARFVPPLVSGAATACTALTEPDAGSDLAAMTCRARAVPGGWQLDGRKAWITNARHAATVIVFAQTGDAGDGASIGAFVVDADAPGVTRLTEGAGPALASSGVGGFVFEACRVPADHVVLQPGTAFKDTLAALNGARICVAAMCCGMVRAALDHAIAHGTARTAFGSTLAATPAWRWPLAQAAADLAAATGLVRRAEVDFGTGRDARRIAAEAKIFATDMAARQIPVLAHATGAAGLKTEAPFARHLVAAGIARLIDGSTEMLLDRVSRDLVASGTTR
ncbi:acyl-CoA dehydrogenase family protein [Roseivivax sp. CAU 1761]